MINILMVLGFQCELVKLYFLNITYIKIGDDQSYISNFKIITQLV